MGKDHLSAEESGCLGGGDPRYFVGFVAFISLLSHG